MVNIYINGKLIDGNETPFVLVWKTDAERIKFAQMVLDMAPAEHPRAFIVYPHEMPYEEAGKLISDSIESL